MQHTSTSDDRLLALEVETALKALGIAVGDDDARDGDLRLAVEDLRRAAPLPKRLTDTSNSFAPTLLAGDDEIFDIR